MSRSGYTDDFGEEYGGQMELYRANVDRAIAGKRGQRLLRDILAGMDALPEKRLCRELLVTSEGERCSLGCAMKHRQFDDSKLVDEEVEYWETTKWLDISRCLAAEVMHVNDDAGWRTAEEPEERFVRVRAWVVSEIREEAKP